MNRGYYRGNSLVNRWKLLEDLLERGIYFGGVPAEYAVQVVQFALDLAHRLQEELADVGGDRGVARRDAIGGQEKQEFSEDVIDGRGGAEILDGTEEIRGECLGIIVHLPLLLARVVGAEGGVGVAAWHTARASCW
jgi:hypothetical protein